MNDADRRPAPLLLASANSAWNILNFRLPLLDALRADGFAVACAVPPGPGFETLRAAGMAVHPLPLRPAGTSPLQEARLLAAYWTLLRRLRPAAFLGFTPKPNLYGSIAASRLGITVINNVTGLGTAFIAPGPLRHIVPALYRQALGRSHRVFFHNDDDRSLFEAEGLVRPDQAAILPGSGVDLNAFAPLPLPSEDCAPVFLFVGRLIDEKGAREFAAAARDVRAVHPKARFRMVGAIDGGPRGVRPDEVERWVAEGTIDYLGSRDDVRPAIAAADCVVLPSYREGLPRVLLEAAAMARPTIASDVPGCRHAMVPGETGILCDVRSSRALADAMVEMIALGTEGRARMGRAGRALMERDFGEDRVIAAYRDALSDVMTRATVERGARLP